jgi:hypothetical protein
MWEMMTYDIWIVYKSSDWAGKRISHHMIIANVERVSPELIINRGLAATAYL